MSGVKTSRVISPNHITTGDPAIDSAHNYAIATYDYYFNNHGRDSIDDSGMTIISRVHYNRRYEAFWDATQITYGDGDGVSEKTSGLICQNESDALN